MNDIPTTTEPKFEFTLDEQGMVLRVHSTRISIKLNAVAIVLGFVVGLFTPKQ
ncbi:MAG: hypothetical protein IT435_02285 [Phycisphaerales bacterium]|nr:hypothetical protein [Phycisphaerales bacterium]